MASAAPHAPNLHVDGLKSGGAETGNEGEGLPTWSGTEGEATGMSEVRSNMSSVGRNNAHALSTTPAKPTRRGGPDGTTPGSHEFSRSAEAFRAS